MRARLIKIIVRLSEREMKLVFWFVQGLRGKGH